MKKISYCIRCTMLYIDGKKLQFISLFNLLQVKKLGLLNAEIEECVCEGCRFVISDECADEFLMLRKEAENDTR